MLKVLSSSNLKSLDLKTIENKKISSLMLMKRACERFIKWFISKFSQSNKIQIFCGFGNNGGDALLISNMLYDRGYNVKVFILNNKDKISKDCLIQLNNLNKKIPIYDINQNMISEIKDSEIIIDGLFGYGLSRKLENPCVDLMKHLNNLKGKKISIDIPSGISSDKVYGNVFFNSDYVFTFQTPKLSFFFPEYLNLIGQVVIKDIGLDKNALDKLLPLASVIEKSDIKKNIINRSLISHKGTFGHGLIISGSKGKMGACVMSCKASLKSGIGLLSVYVPKIGELMIQTSVPEAMVITDKENDYISSIPKLEVFNSIGLGPGIGLNKDTEKAIIKLIKVAKIPLVVDADAINIISKNKNILKFLPEGSVLTPHPKEFKRLMGTYKDSNQRIELQKKLSKKFKLNILIKGPFSMMTDINGNLFINSTGNPGMATGGSGDVLTGIITGLIGRGYKPFNAMIMGVYIHGLSGDISKKKLGEESLMATDLIDNLPKAFKKIDN